ncbi:MAG: hypothetical protein RIC80_18285 [Cyclobacteriaceae bacterium]
MDKKAKKILFETYWSSQGWKSERTTNPEDFEYAKSKGLMFDNITISLVELKPKLEALLDETPIAKVVNAFLSSMTNKRLDWRSGVASYMNAQLMLSDKRHNPRPNNFVYDNEDLNVLNFERIKWSGVRHSELIYNYLDLKILNQEKVTDPTDEDIQIFKNILSCIEQSEPNEYPSKLRDRLMDVIKASKDQRHTLMEILGCCNILQPRSYDRPTTGRHDWAFVEYWRGEDKYNQEFVSEIFGSKLK